MSEWNATKRIDVCPKCGHLMVLIPLYNNWDWYCSRCGTTVHDCWISNKTEEATAQPIVHGEWIESYQHLWYTDEHGDIDYFRLDVDDDGTFHNGPQCRKCDECQCMFCYPDWMNSKCEIPHYICSVCGNPSLERSEYCPHCEADMRGVGGEE